MVYRVLFGMVPMLIIGFFVTGVIPMSWVMPTSEYRSPAAKGGGEDGARKARTPEGRISQSLGLISVEQIQMMEENMEASGYRTSVGERSKDEQRARRNLPGWQAKSSGWGKE